ncbi:hypothetical protein DM02DRAFT_661068 [Periconia macrospinosa]|uniref:Uncharacterized protein n=1 Tax=Periconia macrospinosa TaxID=97972 RepID=A0A2V1D8L0_9PLEO|nr:hypothetical protein DM02DRAFT_661068 [Periconia macrospinosa]
MQFSAIIATVALATSVAAVGGPNCGMNPSGKCFKARSLGLTNQVRAWVSARDASPAPEVVEAIEVQLE